MATKETTIKDISHELNTMLKSTVMCHVVMIVFTPRYTELQQFSKMPVILRSRRKAEKTGRQ